MSPSPIRAENQRMTNPRNASNSATAATAPASSSTIASSRGRMPLSMIFPSSTGLTTVMSESRMVAIRKKVRYSRYGLA